MFFNGASRSLDISILTLMFKEHLLRLALSLPRSLLTFRFALGSHGISANLVFARSNTMLAPMLHKHHKFFIGEGQSGGLYPSCLPDLYTKFF